MKATIEITEKYAENMGSKYIEFNHVTEIKTYRGGVEFDFENGLCECIRKKAIKNFTISTSNSRQP